MRFTLAVFVATAFICGIAYAGPREESLSYNSRCIRAHADRYDYIPSTSQNATLDAASGNPKKVLSLLIGYVLDSQKDFQNGVRLGASNPKLKGIDPASKRELIASFRKDGAKCSALLRELKSIEVYEALPGAHGIKGKEHPCPHELDGKLNVAKFKHLR